MSTQNSSVLSVCFSVKARSETTKAETPRGREREEREGERGEAGRRTVRRKERGGQDRGQDRERREGKEAGGRSPRRDRSGPPTPDPWNPNSPKGAQEATVIGIDTAIKRRSNRCGLNNRKANPVWNN